MSKKSHAIILMLMDNDTLFRERAYNTVFLSIRLPRLDVAASTAVLIDYSLHTLEQHNVYCFYRCLLSVGAISCGKQNL